MKLFIAIALFVGVLSCTRDSARRPTLAFTAIPDANTTELAAKFRPVAAYLEARLGVPVEYVATASYSASVEMFKNGDVQLAWFGGLTGVQARNAVAGATAIAQGRIDPAYKSYFIAHADSGLEPGPDFPAEALAGKRFVFGSDSSTSGRLMPEYFLRRATGQSPEEFFGRPNQYSGSHDKTAKLVEAGTFDAGALSYKTYDRLVAEGKLDPKLCRVIWTTPPYPDYNWTAHPVLEQRFGDGFTERLQRALVDLDEPALLGAMLREEGLVEASNQDFEAIAALARELGFLR